MKGRHTLRRLALALRAVGLALIATSLAAALLHSGAGAALAQVMPVPGYGTPLPEGSASPAPIASPTPLPKPSSTPGTPPPLEEMRGGPITFSLSGALQLGEHYQQNSSTFGGNAQSVSSSSSTETAGLLASIDRRTATTTLRFGLPVGLALARGTFGQPTLGYYTPTYGLEYGPQSLNFLGGVPLGSTARSFAALTGLRGGDLTFFTGPAIGLNNELMRMEGLRGRMILRGSLLEFGVDRGQTKDGSSATAAVFGATRSSRVLTQSLEAAVESLRGFDQGPQRQFAYQYRADYGSNTLYGSLISRRISNGFLSFGSGGMQGDDFLSGALRYSGGATSLQADESFETAGADANQISAQRRDFSFSHFFHNGVATQLTVGDIRNRTQPGVQWSGTAMGDVGFSLGGFSTILGAQFQRSTLSYGNASAISSYIFNLQRQLGPYALSYAYQTTKQFGSGAGSTSTGALVVQRTFGPNAIALTWNRVRLRGDSQNTEQDSPTITLERRLSPALTLALTYGEQLTRDLASGMNTGRARIFSLQVSAPFAIGNGVVQGRANPRLPATISGSVTAESGGSGDFYAAPSGAGGGMANVEVVLDNTQVQRTDLSGHYQFNFVTPGMHEVRVETSSLPRGVTVDQPYASVSVQGGQSVQISFAVGTFAAVAGHVYGRDASGGVLPLPGISLSLDNVANTVTDQLGAYSFGRLSAGTHTISILNSSLPAAVFFAKTVGTQKIDVEPGKVTTLDFTATPLGSISGTVTFGKDAAPYVGGVNNAYVVAEPGDYAAITDADGSYDLDNLPPGTYTLDLDPETVPDGTGNTSGPIPVVFTGESVVGANFTVGKKAKQVVFSFQQVNTLQATLSISEPALPPRGSAELIVDAGGPAKSVSATLFGKRLDFTYDANRKVWIATFVVPADAHAGKVHIVADVQAVTKSQSTTALANLEVDPRVPLVSMNVLPLKPQIGQYASVRARFLVDVAPGDTIRWLDGQVTKLSRPVTGRVYVFSVKISELPMRGVLLTHQGSLPIILP